MRTSGIFGGHNYEQVFHLLSSKLKLGHEATVKGMGA